MPSSAHPHAQLNQTQIYYRQGVVAPHPLPAVSSRSASPRRALSSHPSPQIGYSGWENGRYPPSAYVYLDQPVVTNGYGVLQPGRRIPEPFVYAQHPFDYRILRPSHHSASVPATPTPRPQRMAASRSPSPRDLTEPSPSSEKSESQEVAPPSSTSNASSTASCRFETGLANSRRRIPYSVGPDKLDKAKGVVRNRLRAAEEAKLTASMEALYKDLLPSPESTERRMGFLSKLETILNEEWPGNDIKVHVFGSSGNLLCTSDSDVDVCLTTPFKALEKVCLLANALAKRGMERIVCIPNAKVPIVKMWDPDFKMACDMNVNNTLALENTRMIRTYVEIDPRVRPLAMIVKHWTRRRVLNDAALGGTLSSYTWICLILNFLQTRKPPILPSLHERKRNRPHEAVGINGQPSEFADNLRCLKGLGSANKESLGELLFAFFRRHAHEIDYDAFVASVRLGRAMSKREKGWHLVYENRLGVEEPFSITRNLGNTADDTSFRGIHMELRRAFTLVAEECDLSKCCEQFVFPPEDSNKIFSRAPVGPKPVLSRSISQANRQNGNNGYRLPSHRGRNATMTGNSSGLNGRRASSHVATNGFVNHNTAGVAAVTQYDQFIQHQNAQKALQENLAWHMFQLRAAEKELRLIHQLNNQVLNTSTGSPPAPLPPPAARPSKEYVGYIIDSRMQKRESAPPSAPTSPRSTSSRYAVGPIPPFKPRLQQEETTQLLKAPIRFEASASQPLIVNGATRPNPETHSTSNASRTEAKQSAPLSPVKKSVIAQREDQMVERARARQAAQAATKNKEANTNGTSNLQDATLKSPSRKNQPNSPEKKRVEPSKVASAPGPQSREHTCISQLHLFLETEKDSKNRSSTTQYRQLRDIFHYLEAFPWKKHDVIRQAGVSSEKLEELRTTLEGFESKRQLFKKV
ncbi:MAG: hypothetical protein M1814_001947 [Vezdaea aestivalis]|nr:MAG: hypothetical protein M1814_001947 [Vezdaea aestivalis]